MKSNHKNFAKWSDNKAAVAEKNANKNDDVVIDIEEEEVFVFNTDSGIETMDEETQSLMPLPENLPPVDETAPEEPVTDPAPEMDVTAPETGMETVETAFFLA